MWWKRGDEENQEDVCALLTNSDNPVKDQQSEFHEATDDNSAYLSLIYQSNDVCVEATEEHEAIHYGVTYDITCNKDHSEP